MTPPLTDTVTEYWKFAQKIFVGEIPLTIPFFLAASRHHMTKWSSNLLSRKLFLCYCAAGIRRPIDSYPPTDILKLSLSGLTSHRENRYAGRSTQRFLQPLAPTSELAAVISKQVSSTYLLPYPYDPAPNHPHGSLSPSQNIDSVARTKPIPSIVRRVEEWKIYVAAFKAVSAPISPSKVLYGYR